MKHLGERVTALVDGQLDHDDRDAALAHLARCPQCQAAVDAERRTASTLRQLPDVVPSRELMERLREMSAPEGPLPPRRRPFPAPERASGFHSAGGSFPRWPTQGRSRRRAVVRGTVAGSVSLGVIAAALASLGTAEEADPVVPPIREFTVEHARSTGSLPFSDPATGLLPNGPAGGGAP